jgi:molybdate/tungstate transport system substrate-binding protein
LVSNGLPLSRRALCRLLAACLTAWTALAAPQARAAGGTVGVFYAGSLEGVNERLVGPAFAASTGYTYQGKSAGSVAIANQIKGKLATPDVVQLADPAADRLLMGAANGDYVSWYFTFARSELVVGFDPRSRFAAAFRAVQHHSLPWYRALEQPGLRLGRTDPNLDPKGYRALFMARLAEKVYHLQGFKSRVLGPDSNPAQIFPEEVLVARMLTGQIDAGIFYLSEVRDLGIPYISLPDRVNLGAPRYARLYATQRFTSAQGATIAGAPILYTITVPSTVRDRPGAEAFVSFVLSRRIRAVEATHGLLPTRVALYGQRSKVPASLVALIGKT